MPQVLACLRINPDQNDAVDRYFGEAMPLIEAAGGKVAQRITLGEQLIGDEGSSMIVIVDYPNRDTIDQVLSSEGYKSLIPVKNLAFADYKISIIDTSELPEFA